MEICSQFKKPENTSIHSEKNLSIKNWKLIWFEYQVFFFWPFGLHTPIQTKVEYPPDETLKRIKNQI